MEHLCEYTYCINLTNNPRYCSLSCAGKMQRLCQAWPIGFCLTCGSIINRREKSASIFCGRSCAATLNNTRFPKRGGAKKRGGEKKHCKACDVPLVNQSSTFCSSECFQNNRYVSKVADWQDPNHPEDGLDANGTVKDFVKRWLIETQGECCSLCGWAKLNPYTNKIPLTADHIDGNWRNNSPSNLRLLCGSCDSLQATYKGANVGMGRPNRMVRYHQSQITYEEVTTNGGS